jgi:hypothetical protein
MLKLICIKLPTFFYFFLFSFNIGYDIEVFDGILWKKYLDFVKKINGTPLGLSTQEASEISNILGAVSTTIFFIGFF